MPGVKDASHLYEVERRAYHAERPGFRITELQISPAQTVPWHCHSNIQDTFYIIEGQLRLFLREPKEEVLLGPGDTYSVAPKRPHLVTNAESFHNIPGASRHRRIRLRTPCAGGTLRRIEGSAELAFRQAARM